MFINAGEFMVFYDNPRVVPAPGALAMLGLASPLAARRRRI